MQYSALDQDYLRKLDSSVLHHSAEQYRAALKVILDEPSGRSQPLCEYLERCLAAVTKEINRRKESATETVVSPGSESVST